MNKPIKLNVKVSNEYVKLSEFTSTFNSGNYEVSPTKVTRIRAGNFTPMRYYYHAYFIGLDGMLDCCNRPLLGIETREGINRKQNPKFNPKKLEWDGNTAYFDV